MTERDGRAWGAPHGANSLGFGADTPSSMRVCCVGEASHDGAEGDLGAVARVSPVTLLEVDFTAALQIGGKATPIDAITIQVDQMSERDCRALRQVRELIGLWGWGSHRRAPGPNAQRWGRGLGKDPSETTGMCEQRIP